MYKSIVFCLLLSFSIWADEAEKGYWDYHPLHVGTNAIVIGAADVENTKSNSSSGNGHLDFRKYNAYTTILLPISRTSYFFPRVEWNTFTMDWNQNPKFQTTQFYYWQFALLFYSIAIEKWRWIIRAEYNLDQKHFSEPGLYGLFSALFWGSYEIHRKWHYHIGALGYAGLKEDQIYPVIGLDFRPNKKWFFQAVFPIVYSIDYNWEKWRFSLKGRPLKERFRTGQGGAEPQSIFNYSTMGAEFNAHYEIPRKFEFEIYGGYNFGGSFYIKNRAGHNALYTNVSGAPYIGAMLDYGF